jgi:predicted nucleic acid-binding protein
MSGLTYDTGALLAAEINDRAVWAMHRRALERLHTPTVPAGVLAQAWRGGPQPTLSRLLDGCAIEPLDELGARAVGQLLGRATSVDIVDASVVAGALRRGDAVVTSDRRDIETLASAVGRRIDVIPV